jgi:hypothetical protein
VDIGNDIPGTGALPGPGNLPAFVSTWNISDVSSIVVEAGDGGDTINVNGVPLSVPLIINADVGPDTINLNSVPVGASVTVNAGASNDTLSLGGGNVNANLLGSISLDAGDGTDTIFFNDAASGGNVSYTIDATSFTIGGSAPVGFNGAEAVRLDANGFNNVIQITQTVFGRPITVNAGGGDDTFMLGTGILSNLPAAITLNGQAGFDSITVDDSATTSDPIYFVEGTNITRAGFGPLIHSNFESVRLLADASNGAILVNSTAPGVTTRINGGAGTNTINVFETHPSSPVLIEPSVGIDSITVNQDGFGTAIARLDGSLFRLSMLRIGPAGTATLPPGGDRVLVTSGLAISTGGRLDLGDNAMIYDYAGFSPLATVKSLLTTGYNAGAWNGDGIMGSVAAADASQRTGLGYSEASDLFSSFPAQFAGVAVDNTAVLVRHTFYGDTNLDRQVNLADFNRLASGFGSGSSWSQGNFNYDSSVDLADFNLLAGNFGSSQAAVQSLQRTQRIQ